MPTEREAKQDIAARLVDFVVRGERLDLVGEGSVDEPAKRSWGAASTVPADLIRDVLRGQSAVTPDPKGLMLRGARISGRLDLENMTTGVWLDLEDCFLSEGLVARDANLPGLSLFRCLIEHSTGPPIDAARMDASNFISLSESVVNANTKDGAVILSGARIGGDVDCSDAEIRNESGSALLADGLRVDRDVSLSGVFEGTGAEVVSMASAHVGGDLHISGGKIRNKSRPDLSVDDVPSGPALYADDLRVDRDLVLGEGFEAVSVTEDAAVVLSHAHVGGRLITWGGAKLRSESGPALLADGLQVDRDLRLGDGFEATGAGENGAVDMRAARVSGNLSLWSAQIRNESGPALLADGLQVDRDLRLGNGFEVVGGGETAAVVLSHAHIGGRLFFWGGTISNQSGPAVHAHGLQVDMDLFLRDEFVVFSAGHEPGVSLRGARIGGDFDCSGAWIRNESGPALDADTLRVGRNAFLRGDFRAVGNTEQAVVNLTEAHIAGVIELVPSAVENRSHPESLFSIDGLTYSGIPLGLDTSHEWLQLLRYRTPSFAAQPYQQLAAAYRAAGQDGDVRKVLMEQRRHQVRSGTLANPAARAWAKLTGLTLGYGYQPWRALIGLFAVVVLGVLLAVGSPDGALTHPKNSLSPGDACSTVERIGVGLDIALPVITTSARDRCDITATPSGNRVVVAGWALQVLAWGFATLFIAGFTGAVRKT